MRNVVHIPESLLGVHEVLSAGLARVEACFDQQVQSEHAPVRELVSHVGRYRGKMLRPTLCLLAGLATGESLTDDHITLAAVCEMVHMATLVHDDVLDEAEVRRGGRTINSLRGNEAAVMLGDYLIASAFHLCAQVQNQWYALEVARVSMALCSGELVQLANRDNLELDRTTYFDILDSKTAILIGAACELGACASGAHEDQRRALRTFGRELGIAFQIQDDLLDLLGDEHVVGKSVGRDLDLGKPTLPLIEHRDAATPEQRAAFRRLGAAAARGEPEARAELRACLRRGPGIDRARAEARRRAASARLGLGVLPERPARTYLEHLADAAVNRDH
ncbi:MAG: polyprenyl synthetase family protein [Phycisphaeraceae bacterium]|nr:polyprenyl synthetase family protein [Phycisphaeraceae bacterium]